MDKEESDLLSTIVACDRAFFQKTGGLSLQDLKDAIARHLRESEPVRKALADLKKKKKKAAK